ncbi:Type I restriction-modification system specificity subunit [Methanosarcina mazei Tuc01]|uniref:Type I restriction-modification system specificity subunit n=1 Tax=Methanosarcina mazei Tuc01 TaxID=1236903 RepID=M1QCV8_METMZ|nr:hypothetical protein [Methanosarcina mazei]AGF98083.1 Type I restriction-modification system specificity subunit [Methanosarcina mazei Tuc01]
MAKLVYEEWFVKFRFTQDNVLEEGLIPVIDQSEKEILGFHNDIADHSASLKNPIMIFGDHTCKIKILIEPFSVGPKDERIQKALE